MVPAFVLYVLDVPRASSVLPEIKSFGLLRNLLGILEGRGVRTAEVSSQGMWLPRKSKDLPWLLFP